jgi:hypothetical protein
MDPNPSKGTPCTLYGAGVLLLEKLYSTHNVMQRFDESSWLKLPFPVLSRASTTTDFRR